METKANIREEYLNHIASWTGSGKSQKQFCQDNQLSYSAFTYWRKRLKSRDKTGFMEIKIAGERAVDPCLFSLELADRSILRIHQQVSVDFLKQLISCK